jgi:L-ascorbate metabolism protein UlaG (beta-lactamase superfamily)
LTGQRQAPPPEDVLRTGSGDLRLVFLGHGTLLFAWAGKVIHVDPVSGEADYASLPKADLILVTHEHGDHLDPKAIALLMKDGTVIIGPPSCAAKVPALTVMKNGESKDLLGIRVEAVPAYNIEHMRSPGQTFHPKGVGNGYILSCGDTRVYVAGDTENTPEMKGLKDIAVAFLPMNLPYTMTPGMVAEAARAFRPKVLYPYHFGETDTSELVGLLKGEKDIEVRIRPLK